MSDETTVVENSRDWISTCSGTNAISPITGKIVDLQGERLIVQLPSGEKIAARMVDDLGSKLQGRDALLVFEHGDLEKPIVIATLRPQRDADSGKAKTLQQQEAVVNIDGQTVCIRADQRIELRCGEGSIVIDRDGKITIRGTHLLSRSSGAIRIKGGFVNIN